MKKMLLIILIVTIECCFLAQKTVPAFIEKIDLKIKPTELALTFLFFKDSKSILLTTENKKILLILELKDEKQLLTSLEQFDSQDLNYVMSYKYYNIPSKEKVIFKKNWQIEEIRIIENNNNLKLEYANHNFCIYQNNKTNTFPNCNYIYLTNPNDNSDFVVEPELIIYDKLNEEFLEEMYDKWIDTYYLENIYYTVVKLNYDSYNIINIPRKN